MSHPQVVSHAFWCETILQVRSWVSFELSEEATLLPNRPLTRAGNGDMQLHQAPGENRNVRDLVLNNKEEVK